MLPSRIARASTRQKQSIGEPSRGHFDHDAGAVIGPPATRRLDVGDSQLEASAGSESESRIAPYRRLVDPITREPYFRPSDESAST